LQSGTTRIRHLGSYAQIFKTFHIIGELVAIGIGLAFLVTKILGRLTGWLMLPGFILLFIGIALTVSYYLTRKLKKG